jgi:hypothetical protein
MYCLYTAALHGSTQRGLKLTELTVLANNARAWGLCCAYHKAKILQRFGTVGPIVYNIRYPLIRHLHLTSFFFNPSKSKIMQSKCTITTFLLVIVSLISYGRASTSTKHLAPSAKLRFIANAGQVVDQHQQPRADIDARLSAGNGLNIFISKQGLFYQWASVQNSSSGDTLLNMYRMDVGLVGANPNARLYYENPLPYFERYYTTGVAAGSIAHSYGALRYTNVYPGIDWLVYTTEAGLKYDFIVHPGGRVSDIQLQYSGATALTLNKDGSLSAVTPMGSIGDGAPISYTQEGGAVGSRYVLQNQSVSFSVEAHEGTLVIDPSVSWGSYFGDIGNDEITGMVADKSGSLYVSGGTTSLSNIATTGSHQQNYGGGAANLIIGDATLAKFDTSGNCLWSTYYGGTLEDRGLGISYDSTTNSVYLTGITRSTTGIATAGSHQTELGGNYDAFLVRFDTAGQRIWGTYYGGSSGEGALNYTSSVSNDPYGNVFLAGETNSNNNIATASAHQSTKSAGRDAFLVKFDSLGIREWGTYLGGSGTDYIKSLSCDAAGNIIAAGNTTSTTGMATAGAEQVVFGGVNDGFLAKVSPAGTLLWCTYAGGTDDDQFYAVTSSPDGDIYTCGVTSSIAGIASVISHQPAFGGGYNDGFLQKYSSVGQLLWSTYCGGLEYDGLLGVATDGLGVFATGYTQSAGSISTPGNINDTLSGLMDILLVCFDTAGQRIWGTYYGGTEGDIGTSIVTAPHKQLYAAGWTLSATGIAQGNAHQSAFGGGNSDGFLARLNFCDPPEAPSVVWGDTLLCAGSVALYSTNPLPDASGYVWTLPQGWVGNSDSASIWTTAVSTGTIYVRAENACGVGDSLSLEVTVLTLPVPVVQQFGNLLTLTEDFPGYQWYQDGQLIPGAIQKNYSVTSSGYYSVSVTDSNGCSAVSIPTFFEHSSRINSIQIKDSVKVYPNPANDWVYINSATVLDATLCSLEGKVLLQTKNATKLSLRDFASGVYLMLLLNKDGETVHRMNLIVNRL